MNKKSILIISIIVLIAGAFIYKTVKDTSTDYNTIADETPAKFTFKQNLAMKFGELIPVQFEITGKDVTKVEILYNDSIFQTWQNPSGKIVYQLQSDYYGLGGKTLELRSYTKDGKQYIDSRLARVLSDVTPQLVEAEVLKMYPHDPLNFTQGFEFDGNTLYESTGQRGDSRVMKVALETGKYTIKNALDESFFGEGITILGDDIYQLTWQEQRGFIYDKNTLQLKGDFNYIGEGWGLCNDGKYLIMSNGTERLTFRDPKTFRTIKTLEVFDQVGPRTKLNELEYVNGLIYANVWMLDIILVIDPYSGKVLAEIDASKVGTLGRGKGEVLNGIAYNKISKKLYLTGKNWDKTIEITVPKID